MRVRKKDQRNLIKVGAFLTVLTAVMMVMIISIGKEHSVFEPKVNLSARVENVQNLKPGSYVELKGIRVGTVSDIRIIADDAVSVTITMLRRELQWVKADSKISIQNAGLVGDKYLEIFGGTPEAPVFNPERDVLLGGDRGGFNQILEKGENIAGTTDRILRRIDTLLQKLDDGGKIVDTMSSIQRASTHLEAITRELRDAQMGSVAKNINASMERVNKSTASMERIFTRLENGPGTMHSLIYDDGLHDDLRALLGGAQRNKVIKYFIRESIKKSEERN
jgi:ABC-type transporter Mla subunit MlaD